MMCMNCSFDELDELLIRQIESFDFVSKLLWFLLSSVHKCSFGRQLFCIFYLLFQEA